MYGCRLYIPKSMRSTLMARMHDAHKRVERMQREARLMIYWPGIDNDIEKYVEGCSNCQDFKYGNTTKRRDELALKTKLKPRISEELSLSQNVVVFNNTSKKWDILGRVVQKVLTECRAIKYRVKTTAGTIMTRNRRFIQERAPSSVVLKKESFKDICKDVPMARRNPKEGIGAKDLVVDEEFQEQL